MTKRLIENQDLLKILDDILCADLDTNARMRKARSTLESPSYAAYQADCNGYERALDDVRNYLKFK